jgi:hypothetical protein
MRGEITMFWRSYHSLRDIRASWMMAQTYDGDWTIDANSLGPFTGAILYALSKWFFLMVARIRFGLTMSFSIL